MELTLIGAFLARIPCVCVNFALNGYGLNGCGDGYGYGDGYEAGYGYGCGYGYGYEYGCGYGDGDG